MRRLLLACLFIHQPLSLQADEVTELERAVKKIGEQIEQLFENHTKYSIFKQVRTLVERCRQVAHLQAMDEVIPSVTRKDEDPQRALDYAHEKIERLLHERTRQLRVSCACD